jgi:hypothetical protein
MKPLLPSLLSCILFLAGCASAGKPGRIDPETGYIPAASNIAATIVKSEKIDMPRYRDLILTLGGTYFRDQTTALGHFATVVDGHDMEKLLTRENRADIAYDFANPSSWKRIAAGYKPFLVLTPDERVAGGKRHIQLKAFQADTGAEVFAAEVNLTTFSGLMTGANDKNVYYPLYNAFIGWVKSNE